MKRCPILIIFLAFLWGALCAPGVARADDAPTITLKAMITNPDERASQTVPMELPLPREAGKKDVIEITEGLQIKYSSEQGVYTAVGEITLQPAEQKMIQIRMNDIWRIADQEIQFQKGYLPTLLKVLEETKYGETSKQLGETILARLDKIAARQDEPLSPSKHIAAHRENLTTMSEVKKDIRFLEKLAAEKLPAGKGGIEVEGEPVGSGGPAAAIQAITLKILVKNPSDLEKAILPVDYYLPPELEEHDVVNAGTLEVRYDISRGAICLHKDDVELAPGESKIYEVTVRDIWRVEPEKAFELEVRAAGFAQGLEGTKFERSAVRIKKEISDLARQVVQNQSKSEGIPMDDHIAVFIENLSLLSQMKEKSTTLARLEAVESTSPATTAASLGLESAHEGEATMAASEKPGMRGPEILANTIFAGKALDETTLWKMIFAIIGFLGFVSLLFYILWWTQARTARIVGNEEV